MSCNSNYYREVDDEDYYAKRRREINAEFSKSMRENDSLFDKNSIIVLIIFFVGWCVFTAIILNYKEKENELKASCGQNEFTWGTGEKNTVQQPINQEEMGVNFDAITSEIQQKLDDANSHSM